MDNNSEFDCNLKFPFYLFVAFSSEYLKVDCGYFDFDLCKIRIYHNHNLMKIHNFNVFKNVIAFAGAEVGNPGSCWPFTF